jgi:signal transduction histidine kinase
MGVILNTLLKKSALMQCPCTPGIVAIVLEQLSSTPPSDYQLDARTVFDPVLTVCLRYFQAAADASATLADPSPLLRALLLSAPVAEGAQIPGYIERWRRSLKVASLTRALAKRSGLVALDMAWLAGLTHNLADYAQLLPDMEGEALDETALSAVSAVSGLDPEGWLADAVRYHALPLTRTKTAHPLIKILQLAYLLVTRPQAIDSVDVRTGLNDFGISPVDGTSLLADAEAHVQQLAQRYGLGDAQLSYTPGYGQLARAYANQAAQSAIHAYLRSADQLVTLQQALHAGLRTLFGIDRVCLFVPQTDGLLRVSPAFDPPVALSGLAIAQDDSHSILSLAMAKMQPIRFALNEPDFSVVDAQIARVLGVSSYLCQPVMIGKGQRALLLCGEMEQHTAPLWRSFILEWAHAHIRIETPPAFNFNNMGSDVISHDRVRRAIHEIANPLTNMRNYVTLLSARPGTDAAVQRDLSIIGDEIERVARIVRDLTNVEDAPAAPPTMELVSVNTLVSELVRMTIGTLLAPNKISVQIDLNPEVQPMPLQKDQLKQVLFNLAKNAVEAMGQGGHLTLTTRLINLHGIGQVEIEVADTGPGLPEHMRENLFEAISSQKGGDHAGLGLGISHKLITQMGGSIDFITSGSGTRFLVRLPTVQAHQRSLRNASI